MTEARSKKLSCEDRTYVIGASTIAAVVVGPTIDSTFDRMLLIIADPLSPKNIFYFCLTVLAFASLYRFYSGERKDKIANSENLQDANVNLVVQAKTIRKQAELLSDQAIEMKNMRESVESKMAAFEANGNSTKVEILNEMKALMRQPSTRYLPQRGTNNKAAITQGMQRSKPKSKAKQKSTPAVKPAVTVKPKTTPADANENTLPGTNLPENKELELKKLQELQGTDEVEIETEEVELSDDEPDEVEERKTTLRQRATILRAAAKELENMADTSEESLNKKDRRDETCTRRLLRWLGCCSNTTVVSSISDAKDPKTPDAKNDNAQKPNATPVFSGITQARGSVVMGNFLGQPALAAGVLREGSLFANGEPNSPLRSQAQYAPALPLQPVPEELQDFSPRDAKHAANANGSVIINVNTPETKADGEKAAKALSVSLSSSSTTPEKQSPTDPTPGSKDSNASNGRAKSPAKRASTIYAAANGSAPSQPAQPAKPKRAARQTTRVSPVYGAAALNANIVNADDSAQQHVRRKTGV
jgi:hypothetical protein